MTARLIDSLAIECHCSRRQVERAFERLGSSPAAELRLIRAELAGAHLVHERLGRSPTSQTAVRLGYRDARALRREVNRAWGMAPRDLKIAASLHRKIIRWDEIRTGRLARTADAAKGPSVYHRAWRESRLHRSRFTALTAGAPPRTVQLIEGGIVLPTAREARESADALASDRLAALLGTLYLHSGQEAA